LSEQEDKRVVTSYNDKGGRRAFGPLIGQIIGELICPREEAEQMKIEKLDRVVIYVKDYEDSKKFFGDLFETSFVEVGPIEQGLSGAVNRAAISPFGLELLERISPPIELAGLVGFHLKVPDLEGLREELSKKGMEPTAEIVVKGLKELIYIIRGIRIIFVEYEGDNFGQD
jgi:hypothetical protein